MHHPLSWALEWAYAEQSLLILGVRPESSAAKEHIEPEYAFEVCSFITGIRIEYTRDLLLQT